METMIMMVLFGAVGASGGSLLTLWVQGRKARRGEAHGNPQSAAPVNAFDAKTLDRVVTALDRFDRRLEAVEQRMEFSEKLLIQPPGRGTELRVPPDAHSQP